MKNFIIMLVTYSAALSPVILFYTAITPLLSKRYSAKGLYYMWLVIAAGLLIPFRPKVDTTVIKAYETAGATLGNEVITVPKWPVYTVKKVNSIAHQKALPNVEWWQVMFFAWFAGAIIFLLYHCLMHYRFIKTVNRWSKEIKDEKSLALMKNIMLDLGMTT